MMSMLDIVLSIHTLFAAVWTGGTLVIAGAVLPAARKGLLSTQATSLIARRFSYLTIASVVLLMATGGHLAGTLYTFESLQSTSRGTLVLAMLGLWLLLSVLLGVGLRRLSAPTDEQSGANVATAARPWFGSASAVSVALLVVAGLL
ncbi:CopD family protein [Haloferax larsenii]|uniref:Copper resistance protein D n=1 Tax=Haloferax larsenii TaxID=302484 RepID=A0A1H7UJU8_HALLR|nr:CopD family protein [Haloferax larsenii]SEL96928.1 Copper resistance protein D [Haloferax larsenii]